MCCVHGSVINLSLTATNVSIFQANGIDLTQATHHQARTALTSIGGGVARSFELTVYRERALVSECGGSSSSGSSGRRRFGSTPENPFEREG